ncbi:MAG TPA: PQQ-binding-like beta-propeller repeat protein [Armatimonadota bacterium]|nr:PQQ-binding-like beta-propeller repeat protein [Armatimonadota bacterium]
MKLYRIFAGTRVRRSRASAVGALTLGLVSAGIVTSALAADWPQWRGPQRNGVSAERGWKTQWPATGPKEVWTADVGKGFSSVAVANGRLYTMGNSRDRDTVYCLDARTGKTLWTHTYTCAAGDYGGPRATPTVDGSVVYTLSREGHAFALDAATGKGRWGRDLRKVASAGPPQWGFAGSPLVEGGRIIYNVGSAGVALDGGGQVVWKSSGTSGYASPVSYNLGGQRGVALFSESSVIGVNPADGRRLWSHRWNTSYGVNAADPIPIGDTLFISSNYGKGCALLSLGGGQPSVVWQNRNMRNHFNASVRVGDSLYGNDENTLKCIDVKTGAERWRSRGIGKGGLIASDGKLIVLTERGELTVVQATPEKYTELARAKVLNGTSWTHPVLSNGFIYCRSHEGKLVCLDVRSNG